MRISMIAALGQNRVIGNANKLLWHLPKDLEHFKKITSGHPVIMGRKTYLSIGRPLPNRTNIVLTQRDDVEPVGCVIAHSLEDAFEAAKKTGTDEAFVIGGASVYSQALPYAERLYITEVDGAFEGDAFFPEFESTWKEISREDHRADEKNPYHYSFLVYEK